MARIVIIRPNGETEYAELTSNRNLAGDDVLTVEKEGTIYYAKLDKELSTHMFVIKPDGRKLYVQKEVVTFKWKYELNGKKKKAKAMTIPRTGRYKLYFKHYFLRSGDTDSSEEFAVFNIGTTFDEDYRIHSVTGTSYDLQKVWFGDKGQTGSNLEFIEYIGEA